MRGSALGPGNQGVWLPCQPAATTLPHGPFIFTTDHVHRKWAFPGVRSKHIQSVQKEDIDAGTPVPSSLLSHSDSLVEVLVA